jgi:hypothetical protein
MDFQIVGPVTNVETIAIGAGIRDLVMLRKRYGLGKWRKKKGVAEIRLPDGTIARAEIHWYEAHGVGKVKFKIKEWL